MSDKHENMKTKETPSFPNSDSTSIQQPSTETSGYMDNITSSLVGENSSVCLTNEMTGGVKYKYFFHRLYKCLIVLESENRKLLQMVQQKTCIQTKPKNLVNIMDEFAYKVAGKKEAFEQSLITQAVTEGHQVFMARRWKMRYHNLLNVTTLFEERLEKTVQNASRTDENVMGDGESISDDIVGEKCVDSEFFEEADCLPWNSDMSFNSLDLPHLIEDIECDDHTSTGINGRQPSTYEFNDFTIPISSVFIQDLLANHNRFAEDIKLQNEIKCRLFHVLKKTKEQRNQLKKHVTDQEVEIQTLERNILGTEAAILSKKKATQPTCGNHQLGRSNRRRERTLEPTSSTGDSSLVLMDKDSSRKTEEMELKKLKAEVKQLDNRKWELEGMLWEEEQQRRLLSKKLQSLVGTIHVCCRIKPHIDNFLHVISDDKLLCPKSLVNQSDIVGAPQSTIDSDEMRCFIFETVVRPGMGHGEISKKIAHPVAMCLEGHSLCLMTCGPKQSGKSLTMFGPDSSEVAMTAQVGEGIARDAIQQLYSAMEQRETEKFEACIQSLAVNDRQAVDLLCEEGYPIVYSSRLPSMDTEDILSKMTKLTLKGANHFGKIVDTIRKRQARLSTSSHLVVNIDLREKSKGCLSKRTTILFVDLASWETQLSGDDFEVIPSTKGTSSSDQDSLSRADTPTVKDVLIGVNQSLLALSRVFTALRKRKTPNYQDSLLTLLLKPIMIGQSECFLIITVSADPEQFLSTLASLQFAQNAMQATIRLTFDQRSRLRSPRDFTSLI